MQKIIEDIDKISCIIGGKNIVSIIYQNLSIKSFAISLNSIEEELSNLYFERINYYAIINTRHILEVKSKRTVLLNNGVRLVISRGKWNLFKCIK